MTYDAVDTAGDQITTDFEAEARTWLQARDSDYRASDVTSLAAKFRNRRREGQGYTRGQSEGYRPGVEVAIAPLRGMKTNERAGYMAAIPQTKEMCAYTALILLECMGRIRSLLPPRGSVRRFT